MHVGDVVDRAGVEAEWGRLRTAQCAISRMRGRRTRSSPATHDVLDSSDDVYDIDYDLASEPFLAWFGTDRAAQSETYGGSDPTGLNRYYVFEAEGQEFMVISLAWRASDATLDWANQVIAEHPTLPVILSSHEVLNVEADAETQRPSTDCVYGTV